MGYLEDLAAAHRERRRRLAGRHPDAGPLVPRPRPKVILIVDGRQQRPPTPPTPPPAPPKYPPLPPPREPVPPSRPRLDQIIRVVADRYGIGVSWLIDHRRTAPLVEARHVVVYLARELTDRSYPQIGRRLDRDYSTCIYAAQSMSARVASDPELARRVEAIRLEVCGVAP